MKRKSFITLLLAVFAAASLLFCGCFGELKDAAKQEISSAKKALNSLTRELDGDGQSSKKSSKPQSSKAESSKAESSRQTSAEESSQTDSSDAGYTMADVKALQNTENFAKKTLEHIFDGTINSKGNATGYHYTRITDSKGEVIEGTESKKDRHGVFTAKVKVNGVKKNGFSSFYPEDWTPQQVVDAVNEAYDSALSDPSNPHGSLWIGYSGDLEIDMYLDGSKKITTAYPIYEGE